MMPRGTAHPGRGRCFVMPKPGMQRQRGRLAASMVPRTSFGERYDVKMTELPAGSQPAIYRIIAGSAGTPGVAVFQAYLLSRSSSSTEMPCGPRMKQMRTPGRMVVGSLVNSTPSLANSAGGGIAFQLLHLNATFSGVVD